MNIPNWKDIGMMLIGIGIGVFLGLTILIQSLSMVGQVFSSSAMMLQTGFISFILLLLYFGIEFICRFTVQRLIKGMIIGILLAYFIGLLVPYSWYGWLKFW